MRLTMRLFPLRGVTGQEHDLCWMSLTMTTLQSRLDRSVSTLQFCSFGQALSISVTF